MKNIKIFIIIGISLIIIFLGYQYVNAKNSQTNSEKTVSPKIKRISQKISASGKVIAKKQIELKFQTSGYLSWVGVKEGDNVKAWQAVASLDKRDLEKRLTKALRDYSKERWDFEEDNKDTYKGQFVTDTIKRILEKNQFDLDKAVLDVEIADIALQYSTLVSPISGIVTHIDIPVAGVNITPAGAVFTIADPNSLVFKSDIDESDIGNIKENQIVEITLDAYPEKIINSKIEKIGFVSETTSGGGNGFPIETKLPENNKLAYKIGMNGDINIVVNEKNNVLTLPIEAVIKENNKNFVYIKENGKKIKKQIITGMETEEEIEIKKGLERKDKVIIESSK